MRGQEGTTLGAFLLGAIVGGALVLSTAVMILAVVAAAVMAGQLIWNARALSAIRAELEELREHELRERRHVRPIARP